MEIKRENKKALVLLSGGLDSATCLAIAKSRGFELYAVSFDYGQRHWVELESAKKVAEAIGVKEHVVVNFDLRQWGGSALTAESIDVPNAGTQTEIPDTYVPARNLIFLSFAVAKAETLEAKDIFIGVNSIDYSGYPDCRPQFIDAFANCAKLATKAADENWEFEIHAPLQYKNKSEIIKMGNELNVDYSITHSCYNPDKQGRACGKCDSCDLRRKGFKEAGVPDPTNYSK